MTLVGVGCERADDTPASAASATAEQAELSFTEAELREIRKLSPLPEVPEDETNQYAADPRAQRLGQFLFFDENLSGNGEVSCASCHRPEHGFSTPEKFGQGLGQTPRHPPSLLNIAYHHWYDWDGKADSLWSQAMRPLESPAEQATTRTDIVKYIHGDEQLRAAYEKIYGEMPDFSDDERFPPDARPVADGPENPQHQRWTAMEPADREAVNLALTNLVKSIAAYQMQLVSQDSPFDDYVARLGDEDPADIDAISPAARRGLKIFVGKGNCVACHNGANFSDGTFHNLGLPAADPDAPADKGRLSGVEIVKRTPFNASGEFSDDTEGRRSRWLAYLTTTPEDVGQFKTPTLRNVSQTPPYMHGGQFETLEEVVAFYSTLPAKARVGHREEMLEPLGLSPQEISDVVAFLETLDGEPVPDALARQPASPLGGGAGDVGDVGGVGDVGDVGDVGE
ncbi:MAG: cytochrome-c peroxidase [Myxococcota bacterium]